MANIFEAKSKSDLFFDARRYSQTASLKCNLISLESENFKYLVQYRPFNIKELSAPLPKGRGSQRMEKIF